MLEKREEAMANLQKQKVPYHLEMQLKKNKIHFAFEHEWLGWNDKNELLFNGNQTVKSDKVVFALGGGSWSVTGSTGNWIDIFKKKGIDVVPFQPSNCAFQINWDKQFINQHEGQAKRSG